MCKFKINICFIMKINFYLLKSIFILMIKIFDYINKIKEKYWNVIKLVNILLIFILLIIEYVKCDVKYYICFILFEWKMNVLLKIFYVLVI